MTKIYVKRKKKIMKNKNSSNKKIYKQPHAYVKHNQKKIFEQIESLKKIINDDTQNIISFNDLAKVQKYIKHEFEDINNILNINENILYKQYVSTLGFKF
jgi:hypothetical protein